jgi:hypothetical protein
MISSYFVDIFCILLVNCLHVNLILRCSVVYSRMLVEIGMHHIIIPVQQILHRLTPPFMLNRSM